MSTIRNLLRRGNSKLGEAIHTWSLPAVTTCPGASEVCQRACYARRGRFATTRFRRRLAGNLDVSKRFDFDRLIAGEVKRRGVHVLRVHVAGDFYDSEYTEAWCRIARRCPRTTLYCYTRSWRVPGILPAVIDLGSEPNVRLWWSIDRETGLPESVPVGVNLAYLDDGHGAEGSRQADLIFRVHRLRPAYPTAYPLRLVCPAERPAADTTCTACGRCWRADK